MLRFAVRVRVQEYKSQADLRAKEQRHIMENPNPHSESWLQVSQCKLPSYCSATGRAVSIIHLLSVAKTLCTVEAMSIVRLFGGVLRKGVNRALH